MAYRSIGQEGLGFAPACRSSSLDKLSDLITWTPIASLLEPLYPASKGELAWPPLAMFKAVLLSVWYDRRTSNSPRRWKTVRPSGASAASRALRRRRSAPPLRFRRALIAHGLDRVVFETVTVELKAKSITVKTGTLVDVTIIASASETDADGRWVKHKGRPAVHGFKAHVGADATTALVEKVSVTPANVNDGRAGPQAVPDNPGEVFADSAYRGAHFGDAVRAKGGIPRIVATAMWGRDEQETLARLDAWNAPIHRVRARIEKIFGTWKRCYGLRRMRWRGLARAAAQVHFTATAYNLKRSLNILSAERTSGSTRPTALVTWQSLAGTSCSGDAGGMTTEPETYPGYRFPAEIIRYAVWLYHVFSLSLRDVELILAERGITALARASGSGALSSGLTSPVRFVYAGHHLASR